MLRFYEIKEKKHKPNFTSPAEFEVNLANIVRAKISKSRVNGPRIFRDLHSFLAMPIKVHGIEMHVFKLRDV